MAKSKKDDLGNQELSNMVAAAAVGRTTEEAVALVIRQHSARLLELFDLVARQAILNLLQNGRKRRAKLVVGQLDLFAPYKLPAIVPDNNARGRNEKVANALPEMSKGWLREKIEQLEKKPSKKEIELGEMRRLLAAIDSFCSDGESIAIGLKRANGK